ncbi:dCTP deaminase [Acetobacter suratthaniensis]|uniref:dCTP deaminase n=1 Tax=Acetobacter suratthaniensis TaxID=1502841 RepID=A0ABS3LQ48_9PROT|nr:dCTP deaminase [Acetobacter suratthaniensis]MBO1329502.1 dCTP deaminase [Acetobacter suratthaniensis]MCX2567568.1 dCTP deaminase [Acetobacter suratthaniensis]
MLAKAAIAQRISAGTLEIEPYSEIQLRGASYVLRLGRRFRRWLPGHTPVRTWTASASGDALAAPEDMEIFTIQPRDLVLGCTRERIRIPSDIVGQISPLSHVARFGLGVTCGADFVNPGYGGSAASMLTLELYNYNSRPLELCAGMPIAHLRFVTLGEQAVFDTPCSIYEGNDSLTAPLLFEEWNPLLRGETDDSA